jgi:hypothetical protein
MSATRQYLREVPAVLRTIRSELRNVRSAARDLLPFVWRATLDDAVEIASTDGYELGRDRERREAEQRSTAPAVGSLFKMMRETHGLTLTEVAVLAEVDADWLERVERGEEVVPDPISSRLTTMFVNLPANRTDAPV